MVTFVGLSGVTQFWESKVKEALTTATLLFLISIISRKSRAGGTFYLLS